MPAGRVGSEYLKTRLRAFGGFERRREIEACEGDGAGRGQRLQLLGGSGARAQGGGNRAQPDRPGQTRAALATVFLEVGLEQGAERGTARGVARQLEHRGTLVAPGGENQLPAHRTPGDVAQFVRLPAPADGHRDACQGRAIRRAPRVLRRRLAVLGLHPRQAGPQPRSRLLRDEVGLLRGGLLEEALLERRAVVVLSGQVRQQHFRRPAADEVEHRVPRNTVYPGGEGPALAVLEPPAPYRRARHFE